MSTPDQQTTLTRDQESMAICAIRYCIGRQSYIVASGIEWARKYAALSPWVRQTIIDDLESAVEKLDRGRSETGYTILPFLGADSDEREWRQVLSELKAMRHD